jgi:hypothetical protein
MSLRITTADARHRRSHNPPWRLRDVDPCPEEDRGDFGWAKTSGGLRKTRHRGHDRVGWNFTLTAAAYNLVRLPKLLAEA